jgi:Tfp pilus assembly protein PilV
VPLTSLTGADPQLGFARVNVLVSFLVSCVAAVLSLVQFGAQEVRFANLGFLGSHQSDR